MPRICNFEGARIIGKPRDWDNDLDGECLNIFVLDSIDMLSGLPIMFTLFKFSDEEIEALKQGGSFRLGIVGMKQHPVFNMAVLDPELTRFIDPQPHGDLGGVIRKAE